MVAFFKFAAASLAFESGFGVAGSSRELPLGDKFDVYIDRNTLIRDVIKQL